MEAISTQARIPLLEYYHLHIYFRPDDCRPVTVYAEFDNKTSKAVIVFDKGVFQQAIVEPVEDAEPLDTSDTEKFQHIVDLYLSDIVKAWIDSFVFRKEVRNEIITRRIN
jgi:hypothetical protein